MASTSQNNSDERDPAFERVIFFSDGIFAIAITLLALEIRLPHVEPARIADELPAAVLSLLPLIAVYALSYAVVGIYWVAHHRMFRMIKRYNYRLVWLNLLFLFFIAFLPVPTAVLGEYWSGPATNVFYAISITLLGIAEYILWWYASTHGMVNPAFTPRDIEYFGRRIVVPTVIFFVSIPLVYLVPDNGKFFWALIIPVNLWLARRYPTEARKRDEGA